MSEETIEDSAAGMSEVTEEPLDAALVSTDEAEEMDATQTDQPSQTKGRSRIPDLSTIVEGKRTKKTVERLEFQISKPTEKLKVEDGGGDKLGEIPRTNYLIGKLKPEDLKPLHNILFDRPGKIASMRKNMRQFNGFPFEVNSEQYVKKREKLLRNSSFTNPKLRSICKVLDLEKKGPQSDLVERILTFLSAPKNSGKPLLSKRKKKSKKKLSADDSKAKSAKKPRPRSTSASPKKTKTGSKSKAIVMDSSSDDDDDVEEEEDEGASAQAEADQKESGNDQEKSDDSDDSEGEEEDVDDDDDADEEEEEESPKTKPASRKAAKRPRAPTKKTAPPRKKSKMSDSSSDSEADEKPERKVAIKRTAPAKPAAKTKKADSSSGKKADSSSGKKASTVSEGSSDDDRPLIKMIQKAPSDQQLKETVQRLLKDANLEDMTMKQICQRVYDAYPDHDLTSRKDFIKQRVKSVIT